MSDIRVERTDAAFADAFDQHHKRLFRVAFLLCNDRAQAEDLVAEAFAKVYPKWRAGRVDDLGPYLRQAVVNQVRGRWRRRTLEQREEIRQRADDRGAKHFADATADHDEMARALMSLPARQRAAIVLRYFEDRSEAETAEILGTSVGTVKSQVSRGLDRLRGVLDPAGGVQ